MDLEELRSRICAEIDLLNRPEIDVTQADKPILNNIKRWNSSDCYIRVFIDNKTLGKLLCDQDYSLKYLIKRDKEFYTFDGVDLIPVISEQEIFEIVIRKNR